jgi:hypothetical protein
VAAAAIIGATANCGRGGNNCGSGNGGSQQTYFPVPRYYLFDFRFASLVHVELIIETFLIDVKGISNR